MFTSRETMHLLILVQRAIRSQARMMADEQRPRDRASAMDTLQMYVALEQKLDALDKKTVVALDADLYPRPAKVGGCKRSAD